MPGRMWMIGFYQKFSPGYLMRIHKFPWVKPDGRYWIQYRDQPFPEDFKIIDPGQTRPSCWQPPTVRYNAMRGEWVAVSASRQNRPLLPPPEYCPLCPREPVVAADGTVFKSEVPQATEVYQWAVFENMFPALSQQGQKTGVCEVILYSPEHHATLASCNVAHIQGLIKVWQDRSRLLSQNPNLDQVFIFENKGAEIGVTLHHPHGQLYAFETVPPFLAREQEMGRRHYQEHGSCLICHLCDNELADGRRLVYSDDHMVAYIPEAARYPYEVHLTSRSHRPLIHQLSDQEVVSLAKALKDISNRYNQLFGFELPYTMVHHQAKNQDSDCPFYHWHIEFYPIHRSANKIKFLAGVESGSGMFINDTIAEEKAAELRRIEVSWS